MHLFQPGQMARYGCFALVCLAGSLGMTAAADWTQFRGPLGNGQSAETGLPTTWSDTENLVWKAELPGYGTSSPIVLGDKVFLTCYAGYGLDGEQPGDIQQLTRQVICIDRRDGTLVWEEPIETRQPEREYQGFQALHGYASSTPITDGERLYVFFGISGVHALDLDGNKLWSASVGQRTDGWGSATSPVLYEDLLIVNAAVEGGPQAAPGGGRRAPGALVALNKNTGEVVWTASDIRRAWNSPTLVPLPDGKTELVLSVEGELLGFDPTTGEKLWSCSGIQDYVCPSVISHEGVVFAIGARRNTAIAVRAGGRGDVTETHKIWEASKGSNVSSPVHHEGHLYWVNEGRGVAYCLNAETGEVIYEERLQPASDRIYASPVVADGKIYYVSRENGTFVLAARPEFELLAHNVFASDNSIFNASPAVSNGQLFLRSDRYLYCIGTE